MSRMIQLIGKSPKIIVYNCVECLHCLIGLISGLYGLFNYFFYDGILLQPIYSFKTFNVSKSLTSFPCSV